MEEQGSIKFVTHVVYVTDCVLTIGTEEECNDRAAFLERRGWFGPEDIVVEEIQCQ